MINTQKDNKNLKEVEDDPTYPEEQRQLQKDWLDEFNSEKKIKRGSKYYHKLEKSSNINWEAIETDH